MPTFPVEDQQFAFADTLWHVVCYDEVRGDYYRKMRKLEGSKALDFVALCSSAGQGKRLWLIEATDYRARRLPKMRDLALEVAQKTRDSVAGIAGFHRTSSRPADWEPLAKALLEKSRPVYVLLWLEQSGLAHRKKQFVDTLTKEIKRLLAWLGARVLVTSQEFRDAPDGLVVSDRPAGQAN
jgi:hypothetical protein